jgi:hypothetical protein
MSIETVEIETLAADRLPNESGTLHWTPIVIGALTACAVSSIMITFAATVGLGVSSAAPTWRDASIALWLLSGIYLVLQALISFGCGGYFAGRIRRSYGGTIADDVEKRDGFHGIASWALAVVLGTALAALIALGANQSTKMTQPTTTSEPSVLSYEIDHLFRSARRPPNVDLAPLRAEAGRVLMTSSSHSGVSSDDRGYLVQLVTATTGLAGPDAERRVDNTISDSRRAISRTRASTVILAFSIATALLLGAVAAWVGAEAGGRHRDGMPLSGWMLHANDRFRRRSAWQRSSAPGVR